MSKRILIVLSERRYWGDTGRSTPDSYLTGQKKAEVLEEGLRHWGYHTDLA